MALNPSNGSNLEHLALKGLNQSFVVHFWGHFSVRRRRRPAACWGYVTEM